jgi:hypothetical protein
LIHLTLVGDSENEPGKDLKIILQRLGPSPGLLHAFKIFDAREPKHIRLAWGACAGGCVFHPRPWAASRLKCQAGTRPGVQRTRAGPMQTSTVPLEGCSSFHCLCISHEQSRCEPASTHRRQPTFLNLTPKLSAPARLLLLTTYQEPLNFDPKPHAPQTP